LLITDYIINNSNLFRQPGMRPLYLDRYQWPNICHHLSDLCLTFAITSLTFAITCRYQIEHISISHKFLYLFLIYSRKQ
jgi:hypothetical protein